jgi:hypothetical protein
MKKAVLLGVTVKKGKLIGTTLARATRQLEKNKKVEMINYLNQCNG